MNEKTTVILLVLSFSLSGCLTEDSIEDLNLNSCSHVLVPDFHMETANRTDIELNDTNESGWFRLSEHLGKVIILDFMSVDASNSRSVQRHIESKLDEWNDLGGSHPLMVVSIGSWYHESLEYLNESKGEYDPPNWILGAGSDSSIILNETSGIYGDLNQHYGSNMVPLTMLVDHEGYLIFIQRNATHWESFDDAVNSSIFGNGEREGVSCLVN